MNGGGKNHKKLSKEDAKAKIKRSDLKVEY